MINPHDSEFVLGNTAKYELEYESSKYIPYLDLTGELWVVFCENLGENWPRYNCIYISYHFSSLRWSRYLNLSSWYKEPGHLQRTYYLPYPDSKVHGANMGPTWGRHDPGGPHVGPMDLAITVVTSECSSFNTRTAEYKTKDTFPRTQWVPPYNKPSTQVTALSQTFASFQWRETSY